MNPETALALAKSYVKQTLDGAGALKGQDGITPHIENGNWWIGTADTGVRAEGKDGKDGQSGSGGSSDVYSTEETVVGTWIDGKPLYRTVCVGAATGSPVNLADFSGIPIDTMVKVEGCIVSRSSALPDGYATGSTSTYGEKFINIWVGDSVLKCYSPGYNSGTIFAFAYYTKTTDTATIDIPSATALMAAYEEGVQNA